MSRIRAYPKGNSLEDLETMMNNHEGLHGPLTKLDNYLNFSMAVFQPGITPKKGFVLRPTVGGNPVPPDGAKKVITKGTVYVVNDLVEVAAFRKD